VVGISCANRVFRPLDRIGILFDYPVLGMQQSPNPLNLVSAFRYSIPFGMSVICSQRSVARWGVSMSQVILNINGQAHTLDVPSDMPLLWTLRDILNLTGTKYGCGIGVCGTCIVLVNGIPTRSCVMPAISMAGAEITTIEGLDPAGNHPVQKAWNDEDVPQCGYCQGGQILTASALLERNPNPGDQDIDAAMAGVLCRCGTYSRIRKAIRRAAKYAAEQGGAA